MTIHSTGPWICTGNSKEQALVSPWTVCCAVTSWTLMSFFIVSADEAAAYCQSIGMKFFRKKWHDKKVIVSI